MIPSLRQAVLLPPVRDPDARDYIRRVVAADEQPLEPLVQRAIDTFVLGCKNDGIWDAIKASCILAGARTLDGALVPLVGAAPTNNNFVQADYDRKTGLVGDGSTKYLDSNRNNNADPRNDRHASVYLSAFSTTGTSATRPVLGQFRTEVFGVTFIYEDRTRFLDSTSSLYTPATGFLGINREASAAYARRTAGSTVSVSQASQNPHFGDITLFSDQGEPGTYANPRLAFYSIGESLDLALLDTRVTTLINAIGAAL